jgi:hypothetical protein
MPRRSPLLLALFVAALLCAGVAAPGLAQAQVNPQPQAVSWLSGFGNSDCDKTLDVPGTSAKTIGGLFIINGLQQAGLEAAEELAGANRVYQVIQCWNYLSSQSNHPPWSQPGDKPAAPDPPVFKTPTQEGEQCYSDPFARHPAGTWRNGAGCVGQQQSQPQQSGEVGGNWNSGDQKPSGGKDSKPNKRGNGNNGSGSTNSCPNGMIRVSPETDTSSGCVLPSGKQGNPQQQEHPNKQGHDNPQKEGHKNGHRQDYPQRQGHQQQHNQHDAS